jgi:hypothetical protein
MTVGVSQCRHQYPLRSPPVWVVHPVAGAVTFTIDPAAVLVATGSATTLVPTAPAPLH